MKIIYMLFMILGCFIGAGFVSGREIANYFSVFGKYSWLGIIVACIMLFFLIYMFFRLSKKTNTFDKFVCMYFERSGNIINWLFALCLFILCSSMFAGALTIAETINVNKFLFALLTGLLCFFAVNGSTNYLKKINAILVPIIIVVMFVVSFKKSFSLGGDGDFFLSMISSSNYIFMNIVTLGLFILETGEEYTKKQAIIISLLCSFIIGIMLIVCNNAFIQNELCDVKMPILALATDKGFKVFLIIVLTIWLGLFTTIISNIFVLANFVNKYIKNYKLTVLIILILTMLCSTVGFAFLVGYIYWVIGFVGVIIVGKVAIHQKRLKNTRLKPKSIKNF